MYTLTVANNYSQTLTAHSGDTKIKAGEQKVLNKVSNLIIDGFGIWDLIFIDLGENTLPEFPHPTEEYGLLVRAVGSAAYYRYNELGDLSLTLDNLGGFTLSTTSGTLIPVSMPILQVQFSE